MSTTTTINVASHLPAMAAARPEALAVAFPVGRDAAGRTAYGRWTYAQLDEQSDRLARGLRELGIRRGMRTVLMVTPGPDFFALVFALFKLGAVMVGIDPGMGVRNLKTCLAEAEPEAFIGIPKAHLARRLLGWARATNRLNVMVGRTWLPLGRMPSLDRVRAMGGDGREAVLADTTPDETAAILFTSGSTGVPKGVVYTHANFDAQVRALRDTFGIEPGEVDLCTFPLFALYAPAMGMSAVVPVMDFTRPGCVHPPDIIDPIHAFDVTNLFGSPALLRRVGEHGREHGVQLPSLRRVISAGAPVPARVIATFKAMLRDEAQIFTPYGATESLPVASIGSDEILSDTATLTEQGRGVCVGRPVGDIHLDIIAIRDEAIATWSNDLRVPTGTIGEVVVTGPVVTTAYFNRPQSTALAKITDADGIIRHRTGDLGYLDERGRLWFCGRKAHRVRTSSGEMYTIPCEGVFNAHPRVLRTALVGVQRGSDIEPVLCVELLPTVRRSEQAAIERELLQLGERHAHTRPVRRVLFHPGFPVDIRHNAKINREQLAVWASRRMR